MSQNFIQIVVMSGILRVNIYVVVVHFPFNFTLEQIFFTKFDL